MKRQISLLRLNSSGFSLIELMVVVIILGLLAGLVAPRVLNRIEDAKINKARADIVSLETALKLYKLDNGKYPTTEQGLQSLVEAPSSEPLPKNYREGGYLEKGLKPDSWGNEFIYLSPGTHGSFDIISFGADGVSGGDGEDKDINSWEIE